MPVAKDLSGTVQGSLHILRTSPIRGADGRKQYECHCDACGKDVTIPSKHIDRMKDCGCVHYNLTHQDLTGQVFSRLTVLGLDNERNEQEKQSGNTKHGKYWKCKCECGNEITVRQDCLKDGNTTSCGCAARDAATTHGLWALNRRLHQCYANMIHRCYDTSNISYSNYGGRGITVCEEWKNDPMAFGQWAMANGYSDDLEIDRIDNNGNYCPENCRWVDFMTNVNNRRNTKRYTANGETKTLSEWSDDVGINRNTIVSRMYMYGVPFWDAIAMQPGQLPFGYVDNMHDDIEFTDDDFEKSDNDEWVESDFTDKEILELFEKPGGN
jgi:hypothetical protein